MINNSRVVVDVLFQLTDALSERQCADALDLLSADERARHDRLQGTRKRRDFACAHALLRTILAERRGCTPGEIALTATKDGKPMLQAGGPFFNLSHADGLIAVAVADACDVGVDVETDARGADHDGIANRFFSRDERAALAALPDSDRRMRFVEIWTLKEAFLKGLGVGLANHMDGHVFDLRRDGIISFRSDDAAMTREWTFALFAPTPHHRLAVAARVPLNATADIRVADAVCHEPIEALRRHRSA
jgi:4'-phosphopantetheinyl transferase